MPSVTFRIDGVPATVATDDDQVWTDRLAEQIPAPNLGGRERGLLLRFALPSLAPQGEGLNLGSLCEPVFSVLVDGLGWFGGARKNLRFWQAWKGESQEAGCHVTMVTVTEPRPSTQPPLCSGIYRGALMEASASMAVADWARTLVRQRGAARPSGGFSAYLGFGTDTVNLGDTIAGPVRALLDGLHPVWGGSTEEHRVHALSVVQGVDAAPQNGVLVRVWNQEPTVLE